jgi:hypothetical protein
MHGGARALFVDDCGNYHVGQVRVFGSHRFAGRLALSLRQATAGRVEFPDEEAANLGTRVDGSAFRARFIYRKARRQICHLLANFLFHGSVSDVINNFRYPAAD